MKSEKSSIPSAESDSMRALAAEARETVILTKEFYSCVVKDPRAKSSDKWEAVKPRPLPVIEHPEPDDDNETH